MSSFLKEISGGVVVIVVAALIGVGHNAVRSNPVKLIQSVEAVSTARHGDEAPAADGDGEASTEALPEGSVSAEQVKEMFDAQGAVIIDARAPSAYAEGHIPGSINIPYDKLPEYLETLQIEAPMDETIVCYCWSPTCDFSDQLATELRIMGYEDIVVFTGGWEDWTAAGYPTEEGAGTE